MTLIMTRPSFYEETPRAIGGGDKASQHPRRRYGSIIPVALRNAHGCLCVVDAARLRLECYDPNADESERRGQRRGQRHGHRLQYFQQKDSELHSSRPPLSFQVDRPACPEQHNTYDCGVFACQFAKYLTSDVPLDPLDLTQADMPMSRRLIAADTLKRRATAPGLAPS